MKKKKIFGKDGKVYVLQEKKTFYKQKKFWGTVLIFLVAIAIGVGIEILKEPVNNISQKNGLPNTSKEKNLSSDKNNNSEVTENDKLKETSAPSKSTRDADPIVPTEYNSALRNAENYSEMMYMSKAGIYDQLTSEYGGKFSSEAAQYAIDNIEADWNFNALKSAENYQETMAMSPEAIRDQLISEYGSKFTPEEADYAIQNLK